MKTSLLLALLVLAASAFGYFVLNGPWWLAAPVGAVAVAAWWVNDWRRRYRELRGRDRLVRHMVCQTFELGGNTVRATALAHALGTPDVYAALDKQRADEEALWISRGGSAR
jgi:hypothetical protein